MQAAILSVVLLLLAATSCVFAVPLADEVTSLPDLAVALPSKHYSGYLNGVNGTHLHYYWVDAIDTDPLTSPVVFWTNGGPGCSSMEGWGYELGPVQFRSMGAAGPNITLNSFTWARRTNLIFLENPPGVGFSWKDDGNYNITDEENAENNYAALIDLFTRKFPEYKSNPFYLSGESYAGIYVPTLADQILSRGGIEKFEGILVGNGVTDPTYDTFGFGEGRFARDHGLISDDLYNRIWAACEGNDESDKCYDTYWEFNDIFLGLNWYSINGRCYTSSSADGGDFSTMGMNVEKLHFLWKHIPSLRRLVLAAAHKKNMKPEQLTQIWRDQRKAQRDRIVLANSASLESATATTTSSDGNATTAVPSLSPTAPTIPQQPGLYGQIPCDDGVTLTNYLNRADVKRALHVPEQLLFDVCYNIDYHKTILSTVDIYDRLRKAGKKVMIYNGITDMVVPYTGTKGWIDRATNWMIERETNSWQYNDSSFPFGEQFGGTATRYENNTWFVLVNGAGHMVPQDRPAAALNIFERFIFGDNVPGQTINKDPFPRSKVLTKPRKPASRIDSNKDEKEDAIASGGVALVVAFFFAGASVFAAVVVAIWWMKKSFEERKRESLDKAMLSPSSKEGNKELRSADIEHPSNPV